MQMEIYEIVWRGRKISFELQRKKVRNINMNLKPDMTLMVSANEQVPLDVILDFVKSKGSWIMKNSGYFRDVQSEFSQDKEYVSGETFKYLGKQMRLKVLEGDLEGIKYSRGYLQLTVNDKANVKRKAKLVNGWFRAKAEILFFDSRKRIFPLVEKYGVKMPDIMIRTMKARWGSCVRDKSIILMNYELVKAPKFCVDYVVLHELVHFIHRQHDASFYSFLSSLMPDWKERKRILDEEVIRSL